MPDLQELDRCLDVFCRVSLTVDRFNLWLLRLNAFGEGALVHRRSGSRWEREGTPLRLFFALQAQDEGQRGRLVVRGTR